MSSEHKHTGPALHNALWTGLVGKGADSEPIFSLDEMLKFTADANVDGVRFDGVDLFLLHPHLDIDSSEQELRRVEDAVAHYGLKIGSLVAPVWQPAGGGSAMGTGEDRRRFLTQVRGACRIGELLRRSGIRPYGVIRIDSAVSPAEWARSPKENTKTIAATFQEACTIAEGYGERLAAEGEICWGGMHGWKSMVELLETVGRPETLGFQADMAHTLLFTMGHNAPEQRLLPANYAWDNTEQLDAAIATVARALRPWTIDFHIAQNDGSVKGAGSHDKTGRHCLPFDPNGKLDVVKHAGFWMRDETGALVRKYQHICWDGCMFPNSVMHDPRTWNDILRVMIDVRDAHGWVSAEGKAQ